MHSLTTWGFHEAQRYDHRNPSQKNLVANEDEESSRDFPVADHMMIRSREMATENSPHSQIPSNLSLIISVVFFFINSMILDLDRSDQSVTHQSIINQLRIQRTSTTIPIFFQCYTLTALVFHGSNRPIDSLMGLPQRESESRSASPCYKYGRDSRQLILVGIG